MNTVMDIKKYILFASAVFVLFCAASCKKDKTESYSYLTGAPEFTLPMFATAGESFTFTAKDVMADDGSKVGYCWYTTALNIRDTIDTFTLTLPDTLCTVSLTCAAFADGYYNITTTQSVTIVRAGRENGSITGLTAAEGRDFFFTDPRDGHSYLCATVGTKDWFRENLAYKGSGTALENCETVSDVFGRFYTWNEAISACPDGWRLSTLDDWADAASAVLDKRPDPSVRFQSAAGYFMGDLRFNGEKMWEYWPDVKITDKLGLSIIPLGYASKMANRVDFDSMYEYAAFWTSGEKDAEQAFYRYFFDESPDLFIGYSSKKSFAANVRCVRDHE